MENRSTIAQPSLWDSIPPAKVQADWAFEPAPRIAHPGVPRAAHPRLSRQCREILARLERGPATNGELARIGIRYSARIMELRKAGHAIRLVSHDHESGETLYAMERS